MNNRWGNIALACIAMAAAWLMPSSGYLCALLGWVGVYGIVSLHGHAHPYRDTYLAGLITYFAAFYWLCGSISTFSGLPTFVGVLLFILFCLISALQYPLALFLSRMVRPWANIFAPAIGWLAAEMIAIRIFPWTPGHTQQSFTALAQLAAFGGAGLITAIQFIVCACLSQRTIRHTAIAAFFLGTALLIGLGRINDAHLEIGIPLEVAVVQGNISVKEKHDPKEINRNISLYQSLSSPQNAAADLIIWPETAILRFIPVGAEAAQLTGLPFSNARASYLVGALSFLSNAEIFNSAFLIEPNGDVQTPYHKQVLIPYGEYTPGLKYFPWMREWNPNAPEFIPGKAPVIMKVPTAQGVVTVSPLICYEDVVPNLGIAAAYAGAQVLVNMSNDAWFSTSPAAQQHHLIASFRAIETGRYLIRSTNTGHTAVVDPLGRTVNALPEWETGVLKQTVRARSVKTPYLWLYEIVNPFNGSPAPKA